VRQGWRTTSPQGRVHGVSGAARLDRRRRSNALTIAVVRTQRSSHAPPRSTP
jgi:hypothetical protein